MYISEKDFPNSNEKGSLTLRKMNFRGNRYLIHKCKCAVFE